MGWQDDAVVSWQRDEVVSGPAKDRPDSQLSRSEYAAKYYDKSKQWGAGADKVAYQAGGAATDLATTAGLPPELAGGLGLAANVATQAVPALFGGEVAKGAAPAMKAGAQSLMQSALKPTLEALKSGKAARTIDTLLDEGINATAGGVRKLRESITELNNQVQAAIANSPARIDASAAARAIGDTLQKFKFQATPAADAKAIKGVWDEFKTTWLSSGDMAVQEAQAVKQGTQRTVAKGYGKLSDAETEAQKSIARGLREEISAKVPEVAGLNAKEAELITALNVTERRALMDVNKNPMGLALLAHHPATWAAFMADKSALFKSLVARMMNAGAEQIPATAARVGIGLGEGLNQ